MLRLGVIFILLTFFTSSCGNIKNIDIEELQEIKIRTLKGSNAVVEVNILVNNTSSHNIYIKKADVEILRDGYSFGTASLHERAMIKKRTRERITVLFDVRITDKMAIISGRIKAILAGKDRTQLSFSGRIKAGTRTFSKHIPFDLDN
jgi:hypothetical protein